MPSTGLPLVLALLLLLILPGSTAWRQWHYSSSALDDWRDVFGFADGPTSRRGHSLAVYNRTKVVMFGGRGNDVHKPHTPRTYSVVENEGQIDITSYEEPLSPRYDPSSCQPEVSCIPLYNATSGNTEVCSYSWDKDLQQEGAKDHRRRLEEQCGFVPTAQIFNDVWMFDVECGTVQGSDTKTPNHNCPQQQREWRNLHPGAKLGGCRTVTKDNIQIRECDAPSERWGHGSTMLDERTLLVYGGFSHECEDYCEDVWSFDLMSLEWRQIARGSTSHEYDGPGARWKFSLEGGYVDSDTGASAVVLFGGHKLWHGFASDNAEANDWMSREILPEGGYMNDLWTFSRRTNESEYTWERRIGKKTCRPSPGASWESRNDIKCTVYWPLGRSGHSAVLDNERQGMWLFGGYSTPYPYPTSTSPGSSWGIDAGEDGSNAGFVPTGYPYYLDDLWFYHFTSGYWEEKMPVSMRNPERRTEHIMALSDNILILYGGYSHNRYFNDTWFYYIDENRWLQKKDFVNADYPSTCTDDMKNIANDSDCVELTFPPELLRSNQTTRAINYQDILPYRDQPGYTPDSNRPLYFGIVNNATSFVADLRKRYLDNEVLDENGHRIWIESSVPDGTPIAPAAANGPRQYAKRKQIRYNETTMLEVWEWCVSVQGEPTRDRNLDGEYGRAKEPLLVPQPRREAPGWDGCRELEWRYPQSRSGIASVFIEEPHSALLFYGGVGYAEEPHGPRLDTTHESLVLDDMWTFSVFDCPSNCSDHGICTNGFCRCDPGYYGIDCSNITCPGTVCHYDENNAQHCTHCCHDGYVHTDDDEYIAGIRKMPCKVKNDGYDAISFTGQSQGICDGFATCQCAPPFVGDDCSIKDCKDNCNNRGYCSPEYPVARCICQEGYFGESCQHKSCVNNCSYPNGLCNFDTGTCKCANIADPLNASKIWSRWQGKDCSFLPIWAGSSSTRVESMGSFVGAAAILSCIVLLSF